jgi:Mor family transcriptional regulator
MIRSEQEKRDKKILKAFNKGISKRMLAAYYGLSTQQIWNILERFKKDKKKTLDK